MLLRIAKNSLSLVFLGLIEKVALVLLIAFVARRLCPAEFGAYNLIFSLIFIGGMFANFGVGNVLIREVAKDPTRGHILFNNGMLIATALSVLVWPLIFALAHRLNFDPKISSLIGIFGAVFIFSGLGQTASSVLKAYERMEIFALVGTIRSGANLVLSLLLLYAGGGLTALVMAFVITEALMAIVLTLIVHRYFTPIKWHFDLTEIKQIMIKAFPFGLLMAYGIMLRRIDLIFMGWLRPLDEVAVYGAAAKIVDLLSLISGSMVGALFPALSARLTASRSGLWQLYSNSIGVFAILGFGAAAAITVLAGPIILFLFGDTYAAGATTLRWLGWAFFWTVLSGPVGVLLVAAGDRMRGLLTMCLTVLAANILLNLWLIPLYSYKGAAIATFISSLLGFLGRLLLSRSYFKHLPNLGALMRRAFLASLFTGVLLKLCEGLNLFVLVALGGLIYTLTLGVLGEFREPRYTVLTSKVRELIRTFSYYVTHGLLGKVIHTRGT
jgi:O-antigen/teichoic acid export membrane protein